ncbi:MAG: NAD(+) kinase, partial [Bacteroidetes bacterium]|nr:NAD(+) kinase [Bacteroidota bacterium]
MKVAIYGRPFNDPAVVPFIQQVFDSLAQHQVDIHVHKQLHDYLEGKISNVRYQVLQGQTFIKESIDVFITLGGDGTL